jgi:hypothetical protein
MAKMSENIWKISLASTAMLLKTTECNQKNPDVTHWTEENYKEWKNKSHVKEDEVGGACSQNEGKEKCVYIIDAKVAGK